MSNDLRSIRADLSNFVEAVAGDEMKHIAGQAAKDSTFIPCPDQRTQATAGTRRRTQTTRPPDRQGPSGGSLRFYR